jgi:hypothetical protein
VKSTAHRHVENALFTSRGKELFTCVNPGRFHCTNVSVFRCTTLEGVLGAFMDSSCVFNINPAQVTESINNFFKSMHSISVVKKMPAAGQSGAFK